MRKLDKTKILSTVYHDWLESLESSNQNHPKYTSSKIKKEFYHDIVMNLFNIQNGLCAYTEQYLCDSGLYDPENWKSGKYQNDNPEFNGQLDHFDESLKSKSKDEDGRKDWLWSNLFMVHSDTNTKIKAAKNAEKDNFGNYVLKPDDQCYDEFIFLEYDIKLHRFRANRKLSDELRIKTDRMIEILGLNYGVLPSKRHKTITSHLKMIKFNEYTWETIPFSEFVTAIRMYKNNVV